MISGRLALKLVELRVLKHKTSTVFVAIRCSFVCSAQTCISAHLGGYICAVPSNSSLHVACGRGITFARLYGFGATEAFEGFLVVEAFYRPTLSIGFDRKKVRNPSSLTPLSNGSGRREIRAI